MAWDTIKILVNKAHQVMADEGLAPREKTCSSIKKSKTEWGFTWTEYKDGHKQYHMFIGLRRTYKKSQKSIRINKKNNK